MSHSRPVLLVAFLLVMGVLASGCTVTPTPAPADQKDLKDLKKFNSTAEIEQYLRAAGSIGGTQPVGEGAIKDSMAVPASAGTDAGAVDYSRTNVQVAGVDEPDIVKNDERYIYTIAGSALVIVDAYPAANASVVWRTDLADTPRDLFVADDRLVLFTAGSGGSAAAGVSSPTGVGGAIAPAPPIRRYSPVTHAVVYDITDQKNPKVMKDYTIDGEYLDARMIDSFVYLVTREQIFPYPDDPIVIPALREGTRTVVQPDVWYFDNPDRQYTFTTITALDATSGNEKDAQTYLLGSGTTLSVSHEAIYVSFQQYRPAVHPLQKGTGIVQPQPASLTGSAGSGGSVTGSSGNSTGSTGGSSGFSTSSGVASGTSSGSPGTSSSGASAAVAPVPSDFNTQSAEQRQVILARLRAAEEEALRAQEADQTTTVIHKIAIQKGTITYLAKGEVPGVVKNQFSMDEYNSTLRVATTSSIFTRSGQYTYSNVFVLNGEMEQIGALTHIAGQETIYATRFVGDRVYLVTFRRVDPFFVIDLATPEKPKVLGELKVPGYSDYLHPYDATHIIGIGKETATTDWGGVSTSGVKLALFDVSDVASPRQVDSVQIGDAGSDSAALSDHHAFLFITSRNLLVIPVRAVSPARGSGGDSSISRQQVWYGVYVFSVTPEIGFQLEGTVQHGTGEGAYSYYGSSPYEVKRSLFIGDVLYTISSRQIRANPLDNPNTTLSTVPLPGSDRIYYPLQGDVPENPPF
ncbi:beta-propeller domain-containing protein [Methanosphaerula subterraneus]|uniref:beta-propeller domain-containing protein n=1 Tax=Methanosphaerula subterraneus TaxID=3350244 RepID=UPI003F839977